MGGLTWEPLLEAVVAKLLGVMGAAKTGAIRSITEAAEKATRWLWFQRGDPWLVAAGRQAGT